MYSYVSLFYRNYFLKSVVIIQKKMFKGVLIYWSYENKRKEETILYKQQYDNVDVTVFSAAQKSLKVRIVTLAIYRHWTGKSIELSSAL